MFCCCLQCQGKQQSDCGVQCPDGHGGRNGRNPPACPVAPDSVQVLQKTPSNQLQKLIQAHAKLLRVSGRVLALLGLFVCLVSIRNTLWWLERLRRADQPVAE